MADINAQLKKAMDGPAPQHKVAGQEALEITEGSGGNLHVKDNLVFQKVEELRALIEAQETKTQIVKDADVLNKLGALESKIQATNDRLNQTLNTQLTGSTITEENPLQTKIAGSKTDVTTYSKDNLLPSTTADRFEIRDTTTKILNIDHRNIGVIEQSINILNGLDQQINVVLWDAVSWDNPYKYGGKHISVDVPAGGRLFILPELSEYYDKAGKLYQEVKGLRNPHPFFHLAVTAETAPTTGQIYVNLVRSF